MSVVARAGAALAIFRSKRSYRINILFSVSFTLNSSPKINKHCFTQIHKMVRRDCLNKTKTIQGFCSQKGFFEFPKKYDFVLLL